MHRDVYHVQKSAFQAVARRFVVVSLSTTLETSLISLRFSQTDDAALTHAKVVV
jgi:hypothetical protein